MPTLIVILFIFILFLLGVVYLWAVYALLKKRKFFLAVLIVAFPLLAYEAYQYHWYSKAIPEEIGITYPVSTYDESGGREGCGTIVFKLSDHTLELIKKDGLSFFDGVTAGRGHPGERYYQYAQWKQTPLPPSWTSEGSWMLCSGLSHSQHSKIVAAAKSEGAFYTTKHEGELVLIPSLGYIVYSFFG